MSWVLSVYYTHHPKPKHTALLCALGFSYVCVYFKCKKNRIIPNLKLYIHLHKDLLQVNLKCIYLHYVCLQHTHTHTQIYIYIYIYIYGYINIHNSFALE